jgi:hypothetical protein
VPRFGAVDPNYTIRASGVLDCTPDAVQLTLLQGWNCYAGSGPEVFQDRLVVFTVMHFRTDTQFQSLRYLEHVKTRVKTRS